MSKRRNLDVAFKTPVALKAVKGERRMSELAAEFGGHPTMIHQWKRSLLEGAAGRHCQLATVADPVWPVAMRIPAKMPRLKVCRFSREIIASAVWLCHRFALSTADVEDLLVERA